MERGRGEGRKIMRRMKRNEIEGREGRKEGKKAGREGGKDELRIKGLKAFEVEGLKGLELRSGEDLIGEALESR